MQRTLRFYKASMKDQERKLHDYAKRILQNYPHNRLYVKTIYKRKLDKLSPILEARRHKKFRRDKIDFGKVKSDAIMLMNNFQIIEL